MNVRRQLREQALMDTLLAAPHAPVNHTELRLVTNAHRLSNIEDKMQAETSYSILQSLLERGLVLHPTSRTWAPRHDVHVVNDS